MKPETAEAHNAPLVGKYEFNPDIKRKIVHPPGHKDALGLTFSRLRSVCAKKEYADFDSREFEKFVRNQKPDGTFHHICGSFGSHKTTGLCGVCLTAEEHARLQDDAGYNREAIVEAFENLMRYVVWLKGRKE